MGRGGGEGEWTKEIMFRMSGTPTTVDSEPNWWDPSNVREPYHLHSPAPSKCSVVYGNGNVYKHAPFRSLIPTIQLERNQNRRRKPEMNFHPSSFLQNGLGRAELKAPLHCVYSPSY